MSSSVLIFKIEDTIYHVEISQIYADRNIPDAVINQFDCAILKDKINKGNFIDFHKLEYAYRVNRTKQIMYKDFDRAIQFKTNDVKSFFKTL